MEVDAVGQPAAPLFDSGSSMYGRGLEEQETATSNLVQDGDDEEEDVCRICRTNGSSDSPLYFPCACSGSIKYVHQDCLLQWLNHSNARQCEVCKHQFAFSPVYADDAPARLPLRELVFGMASKAGRGCKFLSRLTFVLCVWLLFIPFTTFWIWRFTFVRSFAEAHRLFVSRLAPSLLLADCLHGFLLSAGIVFIFLGATSLREYFRHLRELAGHDDRDEDGVDRQQQQQLGGRAGRRMGQGLVRPQGPVEPVQPFAQANGDLAGAQGLAAGAGQIIRRNAENVALRLEMQAARLEAQVEQMFDAVEDADGAEDVPFDELVGMQGPVFHLVENAITVLASNAIFLGLVALVPFTLGRVVLSVASRIIGGTGSVVGAKSLANFTAANVNSTSQPVDGSEVVQAGLLALAGDFTQSNVSLLGILTGEGLTGVPSGIGLGTVGNAIDAVTEAMVARLQLSDAGTVAVGYGVIVLTMGLYLGLVAMVRYGRGETLTVARIHGVASAAEAAAPSVARQMIAGFMYVATMVKVAFLLVIELGVFPLMCGWWLDVCTLGMLEVTIAQRVAFFWASPLTSSVLHWLVGIVYMLQISIFVSLLREVLRPGVLYFLRDPADPNYNPFRDLIDDPIHKHARRVLLSIVVYGSLIVMLVFMPVQLAITFAPSMFPLDLRVSDPFTEIPADMLIFHICIPFAVEHFRPRATIKSILHHWFSAVGWTLGLCEFLLPGPEDTNRAANENAVAARQQPHEVAQGHELLVARVEEIEMHNDGETHRLISADRESDIVEMEETAASEEYRFALRIALLLVGAWFTLLLFNSLMIVLPISLGRAIFASVSRLPLTWGTKCNDLYAFNIGCYVLWATAAAIRYAVDYLKTHDVQVLLYQTLKWSAIVAKSTVLLVLWIVVIPVLIGLLFELLVVVPFRVPVNESPVLLLYQDWALGLVFLKIWTRLVMLGGQIRPLWDDSWRVKFEQVKADGFARLRGFWVLREIIGPILVKLLLALGIPHVLSQLLFPLLGLGYEIDSVVQRFAWLGCLALVSLWYAVKRLHLWVLDLHNSIRDDRYLVGRRLHNFGERAVEIPMDTSSVMTRAEAGSSDAAVDGANGAADADVPSTEGTVLQDTASSVSSYTGGNLPLGYVSNGIGAKGKKAVVMDMGSEFQQEAERKFGITSGSLRFRPAAAASSSSSMSSNSPALNQEQ